MPLPHSRLALAALLALSLLSLLVPGALAQQTKRTQAATLLAAMNGARAQYGLAPLKADGALNAAASAHSADLASRGVLDHVGGDGATLLQRLLRVGWHGTMAGEDLAVGYGPKATVQAWLASPGHRANLLSPSFHRVGVGVVTGSFGGASAGFVTADFSS